MWEFVELLVGRLKPFRLTERHLTVLIWGFMVHLVLSDLEAITRVVSSYHG